MRKLPSATPAGKAPESSRGLVRLIVVQLAVIDGQVGFEDRRPREPVRRNADAISFTLHDFSTLPEDSGAHSFSAVTDAGERLQWRGEAGEGVAGGICMDGGERPVVTGVHGLEHVEDLCSSHFSDNDAVRTHPQAVSHQVSLRDLALAFQVRRPRFQTDDIPLFQLKLR